MYVSEIVQCFHNPCWNCCLIQCHIWYVYITLCMTVTCKIYLLVLVFYDPFTRHTSYNVVIRSYVYLFTAMHNVFTLRIKYGINRYIHTYIFPVVNVAELLQTSDFEIEMRQVAYLCWDQVANWSVRGTYSPADRMPAHKPMELSKINLKNWPR